MSDDIMKPLEAMMLYTIQGIGRRTSTMSKRSHDAYQLALAQRQAEGRYTLEEAAMAVRDGAGEDGEELLKDLERAAKAGELVVHRPRQRLPVKSDHVKVWSDEAYFDDLNEWLAKNTKRITWRFPAPASQKADTGETPTANQPIPGKMPRVSIGRLAVTAAWLIENETDRRATADKVIQQLQGWATDGKYPDILLRAEPRKRAVIWMTKKTGLEKEYDVGACGKTLDEWRKGRA